MKSRSPELKMLLDMLAISASVFALFAVVSAIMVPEYPVIVP